MKRILVTGSSGLIGSEVCLCFPLKVGKSTGSTITNDLCSSAPKAIPAGISADSSEPSGILCTTNSISADRQGVLDLLKQIKPDAIVHTAAQPSHDLAASIPFDDFDINAVGTLNLLEATRRNVPEAPFASMSTNKVYGDAPNELPLKELETRWEYADEGYWNGIPETFRIDHSKHSIFGASKVASDVLFRSMGGISICQPARYGAAASLDPAIRGVELHGFLSYLIKCNMTGTKYNVYGYKGETSSR